MSLGFTVYADHGIQPAYFGQTHVQLVHGEWFVTIMLQQPDLGGTHVGNAEVTHLSRRFEFPQRFGYFFGVHKRIGTVQQQNINIFRAQPGEGSFDTLQNMLPGEVEAVRGIAFTNQLDAAFGLDNNLFPQSGAVFEELSEYLLRLSAGVDICMIKKLIPIDSAASTASCPCLTFPAVIGSWSQPPPSPMQPRAMRLAGIPRVCSGSVFSNNIPP